MGPQAHGPMGPRDQGPNKLISSGALPRARVAYPGNSLHRPAIEIPFGARRNQTSPQTMFCKLANLWKIGGSAFLARLGLLGLPCSSSDRRHLPCLHQQQEPDRLRRMWGHFPPPLLLLVQARRGRPSKARQAKQAKASQASGTSDGMCNLLCFAVVLLEIVPETSTPPLKTKQLGHGTRSV